MNLGRLNPELSCRFPTIDRPDVPQLGTSLPWYFRFSRSGGNAEGLLGRCEPERCELVGRGEESVVVTCRRQGLAVILHFGLVVPKGTG